MHIRIYSYTARGRRADQPPRTVAYCEGAPWPPRCAWCRLRPLVMVADIIYEGVASDVAETLGYCSDCELGTIIRREVTRGALDYRRKASKR